MTDKLKETLNMRDDGSRKSDDNSNFGDPDRAIETTTDLMKELEDVNRLGDMIPTNIDTHSVDMDRVMQQAMDSFQTLIDRSRSVEDGQVARVYEVAQMMLKTALDASNSKLDRKLKAADIQIKKARVDKIADESGNSVSNDQEFDRNVLIGEFIRNKEEEDQSKTTK